MSPKKMEAQPVTEKQRISAVRLGITVTDEDFDTVKALIDVALASSPSNWEKALAKELKLDIKGLDRRSVRQALYLNENKQPKKGGQVGRLHKAMLELAQTNEFAHYFELLREKLAPGVEVLTWHSEKLLIVTCDYGNGQYRVKGKCSSVHFTAIQAVYRVLA
jgi:hypothetical protein